MDAFGEDVEIAGNTILVKSCCEHQRITDIHSLIRERMPYEAWRHRRSNLILQGIVRHEFLISPCEDIGAALMAQRTHGYHGIGKNSGIRA